MSTVIKMPGVRDLPRSQKSSASRMDTIILTADGVKKWKLPPFQRPLRVNDRVRKVADKIKEDSGVIPGVITLGELGRETYIIDGQHRIEAFVMSGIPEGIADVRICTFSDLGEMGEEFVTLNSSIVKMKPDDVLRGLENMLQPLRELRRRCPFLAYDQIKRGLRSPVMGMSAALRCWFGSATEVPMGGNGGTSAMSMAQDMTDEDATRMIQYFGTVHDAWGTDPEYWRLWCNLNVTMCAWLWRRVVLTQHSPKTVRLTMTAFGEAASGLSADRQYLAWLVGRNPTERDRAPCYSRVKVIFAARIREKTGKKPLFPAPAWAHGGSRSR